MDIELCSFGGHELEDWRVGLPADHGELSGEREVEQEIHVGEGLRGDRLGHHVCVQRGWELYGGTGGIGTVERGGNRVGGNTLELTADGTPPPHLIYGIPAGNGMRMVVDGLP